MSFRLLLPALSVTILAPALLHAQQGPSGSGSGPAAAGAHADHKMYEDIEIMRHILDRKLHALYPRNDDPNSVWIELFGQQPSLTNTAIDLAFPVSPNNGPWVYPSLVNPYLSFNNSFQYRLLASPVPSNKPYRVQEVCHPFEVEGIYLKGQGIVYTVSLSSLQPPAKVETARPVSEWESVRRLLRNEKAEPKKPDEAKPAALRDVLLKILAENGRHFSQLGENESLTLVVTVHAKNQSSVAPKSGEGSANSASKPSVGREGDTSAASKVRDLELLGDLHLKQGKAEEAIRAFQQAVHLKPAPKQAAALHRKLAQCYLMLEQDEKARAELDELNAFYKELIALEGAKDKPAPAVKPAAVALPVKLIISAPKKLLDQVGEGKISFEEFRRRASVETLTFDSHRR